jgi:LacI family transcriptional regulator
MRGHGDDAGDHTGYLAMKRLLEMKPRPDGVFCYNDPTAMGAMKAVLEAGLDVPRDVAIVGCGNVTYADFMRVPLTSIDQQTDQIGERAAKLALRVLEHSPSHPKQVLLQPQLVARASTQRSQRSNYRKR